MNKKDLEHFKNLLIQKRNEVLRTLGHIRDSSFEDYRDTSGEDSTYSIHMADHGTDEEQKESAYYQVHRENRYLLYLEEALERIEDGTYGICKSCGEEIPRARLEAVPHTQLCVPCKMKEKKSNHSH